MDTSDIYMAIRSEIVSNQVLMHWVTLVVAIVLLAGVWISEIRRTVLSVFLPLLSLAWAGAIVRFDFFIHRQGAYLRLLEASIAKAGFTAPLWESWKASLPSTKFVVPETDIIVFAATIIPTIYLLFGPARDYFQSRQWKGARVYAWTCLVILILLLAFLGAIPKVAAWGQALQ